MSRFWLIESYLPEMAELVRGQGPSVDDIVHCLGACTVDRIAIPHDCADGFLAAFWRRPTAYLDPVVRAAMSAFALLDPRAADRGVARLKADLASGEWARRFGHLASIEAFDVGYRLIVARAEPARDQLRRAESMNSTSVAPTRPRWPDTAMVSPCAKPASSR
jgi:hypothetical protein